MLRNLAGSPGQGDAEQNFPGRGNRLGGDGSAGTPSSDAQPAGGGLKSVMDSVADTYRGMNPQLKIFCGVVLLYVVIQTVF
jgi:hypothetical protein